jgi:hypothetical protein
MVVNVLITEPNLPHEKTELPIPIRFLACYSARHHLKREIEPISRNSKVLMLECYNSVQNNKCVAEGIKGEWQMILKTFLDLQRQNWVTCISQYIHIPRIKNTGILALYCEVCQSQHGHLLKSSHLLSLQNLSHLKQWQVDL